MYRNSKKATGLKPVELIRTIRLDHGRLLLQNEGKTVAEAAYAVGFGSPSYFAQHSKAALDARRAR
ncbi:MAG: helix-turn-helix domain-containing protein [Saprospiraceae bacterium]|nr:helix-turn-helix domain-containing protein [Saprospiraceae bacterium]